MKGHYTETALYGSLLRCQRIRDLVIDVNGGRKSFAVWDLFLRGLTLSSYESVPTFSSLNKSSEVPGKSHSLKRMRMPNPPCPCDNCQHWVLELVDTGNGRQFKQRRCEERISPLEFVEIRSCLRYLPYPRPLYPTRFERILQEED